MAHVSDGPFHVDLNVTWCDLCNSAESISQIEFEFDIMPNLTSKMHSISSKLKVPRCSFQRLSTANDIRNALWSLGPFESVETANTVHCQCKWFKLLWVHIWKWGRTFAFVGSYNSNIPVVSRPHRILMFSMRTCKAMKLCICNPK